VTDSGYIVFVEAGRSFFFFPHSVVCRLGATSCFSLLLWRQHQTRRCLQEGEKKLPNAQAEEAKRGRTLRTLPDDDEKAHQLQLSNSASQRVRGQEEDRRGVATAKGERGADPVPSRQGREQYISGQV
jgi:hypothetical protein